MELKYEGRTFEKREVVQLAVGSILWIGGPIALAVWLFLW